MAGDAAGDARCRSTTSASSRSSAARSAALGLRRIGKTVEHDDRPVIRGMLAKVPHLVVVEEGGQS